MYTAGGTGWNGMNDINFIMIQMLTEAKQIWPPFQCLVSRRVKSLSAVLNATGFYSICFRSQYGASFVLWALDVFVCVCVFDLIRDNAIICIELVNKSQIIKHIESHFWSVVFIVTRCAINRYTA